MKVDVIEKMEVEAILSDCKEKLTVGKYYFLLSKNQQVVRYFLFNDTMEKDTNDSKELRQIFDELFNYAIIDDFADNRRNFDFLTDYEFNCYDDCFTPLLVVSTEKTDKTKMYFKFTDKGNGKKYLFKCDLVLNLFKCYLYSSCNCFKGANFKLVKVL